MTLLFAELSAHYRVALKRGPGAALASQLQPQKGMRLRSRVARDPF